MEKNSLGDSVGNHRKISRPKFWFYVVLLCLTTANLGIDIYRFSSKARPRALEYGGEGIHWEICGESNGGPIECSSINVPIDQFDRNNSGTRNFTIPLYRIRGIHATQNILLNPGGPGGGGYTFLSRAGKDLKTIIGEGYHLVAFDPRGVNSSTPMASCYPDDSTRKELSRIRSFDTLLDSPELYAWAQNFAKACPDTMGEYGKYINTPQTAADMNNILDALGQKDMVYWGFSYGSLLGQTYATLFPERSKRVIIDGVVNQFEWYEGFFDKESLVDTESVLDGFFDECVKDGAESCSLASFGAELRETVFSYLDSLQKQPISVYINNSVYGVLDYDMVLYNGIFSSMYKPSTWTDLADNLYKLIQGNATDAFLAYGTEKMGDWHHEANQFITLNDGITGPEHWPQDRQTFADKLAPVFNQSLFSPSQMKIAYAHQHWSIPRTHQYVPRKGVKTIHPLLILSTTYDPVCPLISARSANDAFEGSRIVEVKGYGHCSISVPSLCIAKHVRAFLYQGKLPDTYTQCEVDSPYFHRPDNSEQLSAYQSCDEEDNRIHQAQVFLAREWNFVPLR